MSMSFYAAVWAVAILGFARPHGEFLQISPSSTAPVQVAGGEQPAAEKPILALLARYVAGLEGRNLDAIKSIWPTMSPAQNKAIHAEFDHARALRCELIEPRITVKDETAVVVVRRKYMLTTLEGKSFESTTITTFNLKRGADGWVIDSIRYDL